MNAFLNSKIRVLLVGLAMLCLSLACSLISAPPPTIAPDCEAATNPTDDDIEFATAFDKRAFSSGEWQRSVSAMPLRVSVTWTNPNENAVAFLDYLIYSCGYDQNDIDIYFSESNFKNVIFQNYDDPVLEAECQKGDLTLREFAAGFNGTDYLIRYWVLKHGETRVAGMMIAVPTASTAALDSYARAVFPQLSSCE